MTPREYGEHLADQEPPLSRKQIHAAALILAGVPDDEPQRAVA